MARSERAKRGRFVVNLTTNVGGFGLRTLIGLWFTPFLIHHLGVATYGLLPLALRMTEILGLLALVLNAAVARYMTIALERENHAEANRYFNTSLFGSLGLSLALALPLAWAVANIDLVVNVPRGEGNGVRWFFAFAALAFVVRLVASPFGVSTFSLNRFDIRSTLELVERVAMVAVVVVLFRLSAPQLWHVGIGLLVPAVLGALAAVWFFRILTPMLNVAYQACSRNTLKELVGLGGWMAVNRTAGVLFVGVELIVVNRMLGSHAGGEYAAALQWSVLLRSTASAIGAVFAPTITALYAREALDDLIVYARRAVKCIGLLIALPIGLVSGLSAPLLTTWLGPEFAGLSGLMTLLTLHLSINLAVIPLFQVQTAAGRVRVPGLVAITMGVVSLLLGIFLTGPMGWGMYGVASAGFFMLTTKNMLFTPLYCAHVLGRKPTAFLREIAPITTAALLTAAACKFLSGTYDLASWDRLVVTGIAVGVVYLPCGYFLLLDAEERLMVRKLLRRSR